MSGGRKGASELGAGEGQGAKLLGRGASDHDRALRAVFRSALARRESA